MVMICEFHHEDKTFSFPCLTCLVCLFLHCSRVYQLWAYILRLNLSSKSWRGLWWQFHIHEWRVYRISGGRKGQVLGNDFKLNRYVKVWDLFDPKPLAFTQTSVLLRERHRKRERRKERERGKEKERERKRKRERAPSKTPGEAGPGAMSIFSNEMFCGVDSIPLSSIGEWRPYTVLKQHTHL